MIPRSLHYVPVIANLFNELWQKKFRINNHPTIGEHQLSEITTMWLLYGADHSQEKIQYIINRATEEIREKEEEFFHQKNELEQIIKSLEDKQNEFATIKKTS